VSGIFYISTAQSAFISALVKFASIGSKEIITEKNIEAILVLLEIGQSDGNYLCDNWPVVCVFQFLLILYPFYHHQFFLSSSILFIITFIILDS